MRNNVLSSAFNAINAINPNQKIIIITNKTILVNGYDEIETLEVEAVAQIQPLTAQEAKDYEFYLESTIKLKFWILADRAFIVDSLSTENISNSKILFNNDYYNLFSKTDWSNNGWIKVFGAKIEKEEIKDENAEI